ncbi:MAG: ATP synthase F1 subunit epsilon [Thermoguttaceae bacterium]
MKCLVVTPEKTILDVEATSVVLPLIDGDYGVMAGHTPVVARVGAGELRITQPNGSAINYYIEGGFVEVLDDVVAVLSMFALPSNTLNLPQAEQQLSEILSRPANTAESAARREEEAANRRIRIRVARKFLMQ